MPKGPGAVHIRAMARQLDYPAMHRIFTRFQAAVEAPEGAEPAEEGTEKKGWFRRLIG